MPSFLTLVRALGAATVLLFAFAHPAAAQISFKPTAESVQEDKLLNALKGGDKISGRISIPDTNAANLIQPTGRDWRDFHRSQLPIVGGVAILGMIILLAIFLMVRGRIRVDHGFAGIKLVRFASFERFIHWLTASCFIVLALSGLNISFGRILVLPLLGANAFAAMSTYAKYAHDYLAFPFMFGVAVMFLIWIKDNIPGKVDLEWIKQGGGMLPNGKHPPAPRFNAGQKGVFWIVVLGGALMSFSGWFLLFPYIPADVTTMQVLTVSHAVIAMGFIAAMLAHIYIGTVGMEGAFEAMGSGEVDLNWAKEHHSLWVEEEVAKGQAPSGDASRAVPAE